MKNRLETKKIRVIKMDVIKEKMYKKRSIKFITKIKNENINKLNNEFNKEDDILLYKKHSTNLN